MTDVLRAAGGEEFLAAAGDLLLADEVRHNLIIGIAGRLAAGGAGARSGAHMWVVRAGGEAIGAAILTPPFNPVVARPRSAAALPALAATMYEEGVHAPGVTGALPEAEAFAAAWARRTGARARLRQAQRIYALTALTPPPAPPSGHMRAPHDDERDLLRGWMRAFAAEADAGDPAQAEAMLDERAGRPLGLVVWDDGGPVALAGSTGETPAGVRVGPVYTPPAWRGRGYASALVAELSRRLLAGGRRYCALYTDLANPTANRIYARLGYRPACDSAMYDFATPPRHNRPRGPLP